MRCTWHMHTHIVGIVLRLLVSAFWPLCICIHIRSAECAPTNGTQQEIALCECSRARVCVCVGCRALEFGRTIASKWKWPKFIHSFFGLYLNIKFTAKVPSLLTLGTTEASSIGMNGSFGLCFCMCCAHCNVVRCAYYTILYDSPHFTIYSRLKCQQQPKQRQQVQRTDAFTKC